MNLPPFVYVKAFWNAVALIVSGVLGLLAVFQVVPVEWALAPASVYAAILAVLEFFNIEPQVRARAALLAKKSGKKSK